MEEKETENASEQRKKVEDNALKNTAAMEKVDDYESRVMTYLNNELLLIEANPDDKKYDYFEKKKGKVKINAAVKDSLIKCIATNALT